MATASFRRTETHRSGKRPPGRSPLEPALNDRDGGKHMPTRRCRRRSVITLRLVDRYRLESVTPPFIRRGSACHAATKTKGLFGNKRSNFDLTPDTVMARAAGHPSPHGRYSKIGRGSRLTVPFVMAAVGPPSTPCSAYPADSNNSVANLLF